MKASGLELVNNVYTLATLLDGEKVILKINQALCDNDPLQQEVLFQSHQLRAHGVRVADDCASRHVGADGQPGGQCILIVGNAISVNAISWADDLQKYSMTLSNSPLADHMNHKAIVIHDVLSKI